MARLFLALILFTAHRCNDGSFFAAARLPTAQAFAPSLRNERSSLSKNNIHYEVVAATANRRLPHSRRRQPDDTTQLRIMDNSENESRGIIAPDNNTRFLLPITALITLSLATLAAFTQHLPGPPIDATSPPPFFSTLPYGVIFSGSCDPYSNSLIVRDLSATILSIVGASVFVKAITYPAKMGKLESRDARKLIHTLSAPLFILLWPLFSNAYGARVFASIVPLLNTVRLYVAGTGGGGGGSSDSSSITQESSSSSGKQSSIDDTKNNNSSIMGSESELADAISRSGDAKEALGGPFIYVLVLLFSTFVFWTDSPIGIVSIATMAVGDGLADLVGRRLGSSNKWAFNKSKSMAGSAAFVIGSFVGSYGLISWLTSTGSMDPLLELGTMGLVARLLAIAVVCAGVELIPAVDDNWTVPLSAALLSAFLL
ncbi:hypothetical protein ACHAXR_010924 [Thalassiosira sp. AJA248-18]